jgi:hypothetical protein
MTPRNVAFVGAICMTIGWLLASVVTPPVARVQSLPAQRQPARETPVEPTFTEHLQIRLEEARPLPERRRNPFTFAGRERQPEFVRGASDTGSEPIVPAEASPAPLPFALAGVGISGENWTAVLATSTGVLIVAAGDTVLGYTVTAIDDASVSLSRDGATITLRFAP